MTAFVRTCDENFANLTDFQFTPHYHVWQDLRMHYIDEGSKDAPVMLLLHGMPTWSYLYRDFIEPLVSVGYRCVAPDYMGFGRSDKPTDIHWYTIARHAEIVATLITALDLQDITLVCQDWGGPIGLAQAVTMPERFARLTIMNTWLHHDGYEYSPVITNWNRQWHEGGLFCRQTPNLGTLLLLNAGLVDQKVMIVANTEGIEPQLDGSAAVMYQGFSAPHRGLPDDGYNGLRRFPLSIPLDSYDNGNGAMQAHCYHTLLGWPKPAHFIWGCKDQIFPEAWGREWASRMQASFDPIADANHFLQNTHAREFVDTLLGRIEAET